MWSTNPKHIPRSEAAFSMLICNNNAASFMTEGSTSSTNSSCTWIAITAHLSVSRNTCCTIRIESKEKAHYINKAKRMNFHIFYLVFIILAFSDWCMPEGWKKKFWTMKKKKAVFPSDLQYDSAVTFEHLKLCRKWTTIWPINSFNNHGVNIYHCNLNNVSSRSL